MTSRSRIAALDPLLQIVLKQGAVAFVIKVLAALLSFLMLLAIARALSADEFGHFGFAFSLVTLLALAGSIGQRSAVLRFAGSYRADPDPQRQYAVIRFGYIVVLCGCAIAASGLVAAAALVPELPDYLFAAAGFVIVLGLAEYQAHALRSGGNMMLALLPRDVLWRGGVIGLALASGAFTGGFHSAANAIWVCTAVLLAVVLCQAAYAPQVRAALSGPRSASRQPESAVWRHAAFGLWGTSLVLAAGPNLSVVIVGLMLTPAEIGPFFAALRTSMLLSLFLMAANMIAAPLIAGEYAAGNRARVQQLCRFTALLIGFPTALVFAALCLIGDWVLGLFGPGFGQAYPQLVILSAGYLVSALAGPNTQVMEMAGSERQYLRILAIVTGGSLLSVPVLVALLGANGAAVAMAASLITINVGTSRHCAKQLGIQPGLLPSLSLGHAKGVTRHG